MTKLLTMKQITALAPGDKPRHVKFCELNGCWLRIAVSGTKTYLLSYTAPSGVGRTLTLGDANLIDPMTAYKMARAALVSVDQGGDPQLEKRQRREQLRQDHAELVAACVALYIEACKKKGERAWRVKEATLHRHVKARWGDRPIRSITRRDVVQLVDDTDRLYGKNVARNVFSKLSSLMNWAERKDMLDRLPVTNIELPGTVARRDRLLSDQELVLIWEGSGRLAYPDREFVRLLMLTAQRRNQIAGITRSEVSISDRTISWPADRMKSNLPHTIPLCDEALRIVLGLPVHGQHMLSYDAGKSRMVSFARCKSRLDRAIVEVAKERNVPPPQPWVLHDLRRAARSGMGTLDVSRDAAELVLAHKIGDQISQVYDRSTHMPQKVAALTAWEAHLMKIVEQWQAAA